MDTDRESNLQVGVSCCEFLAAQVALITEDHELPGLGHFGEESEEEIVSDAEYEPSWASRSASPPKERAQPSAAPRLPDKGKMQADGARAQIVAPEVAPSLRYPASSNLVKKWPQILLCRGRPPSQKKRAETGYLEDERLWYINGAMHDPYGRLRSARLSDKSAASYWNRFLLYVAFVNERFGKQDTVRAYLDAAFIEAYFSSIGEGVMKKGGSKEPASSHWIDTVKRTLNSITYCFLWPHLTQEQWLVYENRILQAKILASKAAQTMARQRQRGDLFVADAICPDGGFFVKKSKPTLETVLARVKLWEEKTNNLEFDFQANPESAKAALELAKAKMALLATQLLLWTGSRVGELRKLVVNWDVACVRESSGAENVYVAPVQDKTNWRQETHVQVKDTGKILHSKVLSLYQDFLRRHRPVLMKNLGEKSRHHITFSDELHGAGASACFALFPGFWDDSQVSAFTQKLIVPVCGATERPVRRELSKNLSRNAKEWGIHKAAIHQSLHHSEEVHNQAYLAGMRNDVNELQAWLLSWQ